MVDDRCWLGIEEPFPWIPVGVVTFFVLVFAAAIGVGLCYVPF